MQTCRYNLIAVLLLLAMTASAFALSSEENVRQSTPESLFEWKNWVLFDKAERLCPTHYNDGESYCCNWPSRLRLDLDASGGTFIQEWMVFTQGWQPLAGDAGLGIWPVGVRVDDQETPVINRGGRPYVHLTVGRHVVTGGFDWQKLPETIPVPPAVGLIDLAIEGRTVKRLQYDPDGRLWLQPRKGQTGAADRLQVHVFRLLDDTIPMRITSLFRLDVSGRAREIRLDDVLPHGTRAIGLQSPLPAKLGPGGALFVQARPGQWKIQITARSEGPVTKMTVPGAYTPEIWSFQARNHLRMVEISGASTMEPARTDMPLEWRAFPAYLIKAGNALVFKEVRRGDPDPAPDRLTLARTWWLDFDGDGFTLQDRLQGTVSRQWSVAMAPPFDLGRVSVDGRDRMITRHGPNGLPGVELRRGSLNLAAEARYGASVFGTLPAVGWTHDFQKVSGVLNLPPGWRLLAADGVDRMDGSWIQQWTLLDFFLVLIIALAVYKIRNWRWGLVALVTMALVYQEPNAPVYVWLHILAAMALLNVLPEGRIRGLVKLWGFMAIVVLLAMAIPFMVQQIRWGIYPQLERADVFTASSHRAMAPSQQTAQAPAHLPEEALDGEIQVEADRTVPAKMKSLAGSSLKPRPRPVNAVEQFDPDALVPTGPGLPRWRWRAHPFAWNGPVQSSQTCRFWLIPPWANLLLAVVRVLLLGVLILGVVHWKTWWQTIRTRIQSGVAAGLLGAVVLVPLLADQSHAVGGGFPPTALLEQLEKRLLEKPDCLPDCADIVQMEMTARPDALQVLLRVHAAVQAAIPLPITAQSWAPAQVSMDGSPARDLARDANGRLWGLVPKGVHTIALTGPVAPGLDTIQLSFPLRPHSASFSAEGWQVLGIAPDGRVAGTIQLVAEKPAEEKSVDYKDNVLPPFLHVHRTLHLGLTWQVATTVTRITPTGTPVVVSLPLLAGESVTTPGIETRQGAARLDMAPAVKRVRFDSVLALAPELKLAAPRAVPWTETWTLDASPVWHCEMQGIPAIHHQGKRGQWQPEWRPWPGETVDIRVTRPEAVPGRSLTLDAAELVFIPGQRFDRARLKVAARTSTGGRHWIELPAAAVLQLAQLNGKTLPIRAEERGVPIPLEPGAQEILLEWHQPSQSRLLIKAPPVKIGEEAVNATVSFEMPENRWILFTGGPRLGPAVLFWSYLLVMVLVAFALARTRLTPLTYVAWILLTVGLTQSSIPAALIVVGWFFVLAWREKAPAKAGWFQFDLVQVVIVLWTLAALTGLYEAVERGLLGTPDMQIAGNGSTRYLLHWTQDRIGAWMPQPWALTLPMWLYRMLMLFWSLWLAFALLKWLRWGWTSFSRDGIWKKPPPIRRKPKAEASLKASEGSGRERE